MTSFPRSPADVATLTVAEFLGNLDLASPVPLDVVCDRFAGDANRAIVWAVRYTALDHFLRGLDDATAAEVRTIAEPLAARFGLNEEWQFDRALLCAAIERVRQAGTDAANGASPSEAAAGA
jgi:hypothetical protein